MKNTIIIGDRRSGKTTSAVNFVINEALKGKKCIYIAPDLAHLDIARKSFEEQFKALDIEVTICRLSITNKDKSIDIDLAHTFSNLCGKAYYCAVLDDVDHHTPSQWKDQLAFWITISVATSTLIRVYLTKGQRIEYRATARFPFKQSLIHNYILVDESGDDIIGFPVDLWNIEVLNQK